MRRPSSSPDIIVQSVVSNIGDSNAGPISWSSIPFPNLKANRPYFSGLYPNLKVAVAWHKNTNKYVFFGTSPIILNIHQNQKKKKCVKQKTKIQNGNYTSTVYKKQNKKKNQTNLNPPPKKKKKNFQPPCTHLYQMYTTIFELKFQANAVRQLSNSAHTGHATRHMRHHVASSDMVGRSGVARSMYSEEHDFLQLDKSSCCGETT